MEVRNEQTRQGWHRSAKKSSDPELGHATLVIAEAWATEMEQQLAAGETIANIAEHTLAVVSRSAEGVQLYTSLCNLMVDFLEDCWQYGPDLRRWYGASRWR